MMPSLTVSRWKHGRTFAYSITYDEGFEDLLAHALPVHRAFGIPGHAVMVAGQLGVLRDVPSSSYHGLYRHLSGSQLRDLIAEGWSVGSHSLTHGDLNANPFAEVVKAKQILEDAIGSAVNLFHLPGADFSYAPAARYIESVGHLAVFFADDRVNDADADLFGLGRSLVYEVQGRPLMPLYDSFVRTYDPYHRLHEARDSGGWLVDITHLISPEPVAPWKDARPETLAKRFECLQRVGGGSEWAAEPEEVVDYILARRAVALEPIPDNPWRWRMSIAHPLPQQVKHRDISLECPYGDARPPMPVVNGRDAKIDVCEQGRLVFTFPADDVALIELVPGGNE